MIITYYNILLNKLLVNVHTVTILIILLILLIQASRHIPSLNKQSKHQTAPNLKLTAPSIKGTKITTTNNQTQAPVPQHVQPDNQPLHHTSSGKAASNANRKLCDTPDSVATVWLDSTQTVNRTDVLAICAKPLENSCARFSRLEPFR